MVSCRHVALSLLLTSVLVTSMPLAFAQTTDSFSDLKNNDPESADGIETGGDEEIGEAVKELMNSVINLMGIAAVFVIVIVGILLVVGIGSEESRSRAIKVLLYVIAGILVIIMASAIVSFIADALFGSTS